MAAGGREVGVLRWGGAIASISLRLSRGTEATGRRTRHWEEDQALGGGPGTGGRTRHWGENSLRHLSSTGKQVIIFEMEASCTGSNGERAERGWGAG